MKPGSFVALLLFGQCVYSLIIPEELPTILSLIYSNIPPIKKGTDSRLGVGFRLGEHADFQVLVELGPQKETNPIGNDGDSKRKRATMMIAAMRGDLGPWAQAVAKYQMEQKLKMLLGKYKTSSEKATTSPSNPYHIGKNANDKNAHDKNEENGWLSKWSQDLVGKLDSASTSLESTSTRKNLPHVNRVKVVNVVNDSNSQKENKNNTAESDLMILKELYGMKRNDTKTV